jgi:hypothetical protein
MHGVLKKPSGQVVRHIEEGERRRLRNAKRWAAWTGRTRDSITITECVAVSKEPIMGCHAIVDMMIFGKEPS